MNTRQRDEIMRATTRHGALWMNTYTDTVLVERDEGTVLRALYPDGELADYRLHVTNGDANGRAAAWFVKFLAGDVEAGLLDDLADSHPFEGHEGHEVRAQWNELAECHVTVSDGLVDIHTETMEIVDDGDGEAWFWCLDCGERVEAREEARIRCP